MPVPAAEKKDKQEAPLVVVPPPVVQPIPVVQPVVSQPVSSNLIPATNVAVDVPVIDTATLVQPKIS